MKKFFVFIICTCLLYSNAEANLTSQERNECKAFLSFAEESPYAEEWVYKSCGFEDEDIAWYEWAPYVSQKQYKKALFELCKRYPFHEYGPLYCNKAADLKSLPALYYLATEAKKNENFESYESYLKKIVDQANSLTEEKDSQNSQILLQAYLELAEYYYRSSKDPEKRNQIIPFLQKAADAGNTIAASTLSILLYYNQNTENKEMYDKYMWQAIISGCPATEEFLGLTNISKSAKNSLSQQDIDKVIDRLLFSCNALPKKPKRSWSQEQIDSCSCHELLSRLKLQEGKPFKVISIDTSSAILQDKSGMTYSVFNGDKITDGYVVEEIRPTAVKIRKQAVSQILLLIDPTCAELCQDVQQMLTKDKKSYEAYELKFTKKECQKLANNIEKLPNPLQPFRGVRECQLQDWKRWGNIALKNKKKKHLFLLANYEKSNYIPAFIAQAQISFAQGGEKSYNNVALLLKKAIQLKATEKLEKNRQDYAYCLLGNLYVSGALNDTQDIIKLLKKGSKDYASANNLLGVIYARGKGVKKNLKQAESYFENAIQQQPLKSRFSLDALRNLSILKEKGDFNKMSLGNCEDILKDHPLSEDEIIELYQQKDEQ